MNTERTSSDSSCRALRPSAVFGLLGRTSRSVRVFFAWLAAALLLVGLAATASQAGLKPISTSGTGAVLALAAQLRTARIHAAVSGSAASSRTPGGRTLLPRTMMHAGAILKSRAAAPSVVPISGGVQTYDVANPPPAFRPLIGFGSDASALNNNSANPPVYVSALTPTNLTPIWSADETFLIFSSNRNQIGGVNADATDGSPRFHLWAISVNGGEAFQITTSTGPAGGGESFPTLSANNNKLAFTSDAQSPGTPNLYVIGFSSATLTGGAAPANISDTTAISSLTLRYGPGITTGPQVPTEASSASFTGFTGVQRPTFGTSDGQLIVFSAFSVTGMYAGHSHLYFLYQSSGGFSNSNQTSYPGKLTDGPADDTDPTYSPDGQFIAFSTTATSISNDPNNSFGPNPPSGMQDPNQAQSLTSGSASTRSIFLISGGGSANGIPFGTAPASGGLAGGRVTLAGTDNFGPAWSSFANQNQYTNPAPGFAYLAFARASSTTTNHDIYYLQVGQGVSSPNTETLTPESGGNAVIHLNTDDNGTAAPAVTPANSYDDIYPAWSPFLSIFSITYASNRTVTYNNPANSQPTETAVSVSEGGTVTNAQDPTANYTVGAGYSGLLISQVLNLDPPTLLRFSANEVVHVQAAGTLDANGNSADPVTGTPNKLAVSGGQKITLTVRLSDREAGIDDTGGPGGKPRVYVQIKDPDGKYQDSQNSDHKVFAKDLQYNGQSNQPLNDVNSGSVNAFIGDGFPFYESNAPPTNKYTYPSYGTPDQTQPGIAQRVYPRGAHGGFYFNPDGNNPDPTYIFVGKGAVGTTNPLNGIGTDPSQFTPRGPEYEAQVVNPQFAAAGTGDTTTDTPGITVANPSNGAIGDYVTPFWLAGVNDQGSYSGGVYSGNLGSSGLPIETLGTTTPNSSGGVFNVTRTNGTTQTDRPTANYTDANGTTHPAEWLQLNRVPAQADGTQNGDANGGVLYTVTWTTPASGSDFYVDVIAYDKAVFPNVPGSPYAGEKTNWRIYDNVGGFSTNQSIGNNDILLVSDYALGQKFAATTFGGRNSNLNLVPKIFGTESYLSDVDVNTLPDSVFAGIPTTPTSYLFNPTLQTFFGQNTNNGLGVGSYIDGTINDGTRSTDDFPNVQSQRYSIWRILSRGPVPQSVLTSYLPKPVQQPAIVDAADPAYKNVPAATVLDAPQCVIWLSPYTGDVLADPGTIDDPGNVGQPGVATPRQSTTSILTSFVAAGGRLCVTGQDVGSTLTLGGSVNNTPGAPGSPNFLPDVLNATLTSNSSNANVLTGTANRITGSPFYDGTPANVYGNYNSITGPIQGQTNIAFSLPYQDNLVLGNADYNDSSLSQLPAIHLPGVTPRGILFQGGGASIQGQSDVITATTTAITGMTYAGGGGALVFHDDPYNAANTGQLPNGGTGSRVVYAAFGLEGLSEDYYSSASPNPSTNPAYDLLIPQVIPRNPRSEILHNIVSYLRTGRVSGTITQTAGTGQGGGLGIDGVTVYLRPTGGAPPARVAFSALTANGGRFTIAGVEPGTYTLVAVKPGFQRAVSNAGVSFTVEGDVTKTGATLTMTPLPPANIAGAVQDPKGNLINGATVTFTSQDNSVTVSKQTLNGSVTGSTTENYFIQSVPVTTYTGTATGPLNNQNLPEYDAATAPDAPNAAGITVQPNTTFQPVNFTLTPILGKITGTVTSAAAGTPVIPGATVTLEDSTGKALGSVVTAADGTYTLPDIPSMPYPTATTYTVLVTAPGFAPGTLPETVYLGNVITGQNFALAPIPPGSIQGTVTYAGGGPVANAIVTYMAPGGAPQTVTTDATGTYTIANVPPATYTVSAIGPNNTTRNVPTTTAAPPQQVPVASGQQATANFVVTLIPPSFSGTVTSAATATAPSKPLANATITVTDASGNPVATTPSPLKTAADGTYTTGPLAPGTYTVTASLAGYASSAIGPTTVQNGDALTGQNITLTAVAPGSITGTVTDNNNHPVVNAVVTFNSTDGTVPAQTATTNSSGTYVIPPAATAPNVPAFTYTGNAVGPVNDTGSPEYGADPSAPKTVNVPSGGVGTVNFTLPVILASVSGTITDIQTQAVVNGATVTLTDAAGAVVGAPVKTGANGAYAFTGILATQAPTNYTVTVTAPGYSANSATVTLELGDQVTQPVALNEQATLIGLVTDGSPDAANQPLSGVTLTVMDASGAVVATVPTPLTTQSGTSAGPDGQPENYLANLLPGTYKITASKGNYDSQTSASVTLTNVAPVRVNFALRSSIGTLGGLVTDQNGTGIVGGATVTVVQTGQTTGLTFTTSASASAGPDGSPINYSGLLSKGTYTVTVTKGNRTSAPQTITIQGGTFNRLDFSAALGLPALYTFPAGIQFVSTPYDYSSLGFDGLFGALNTAPAGTTPNGNRSNVAVWNPLTSVYALDPNAPADALRLGVGYWVYLKNATPVTQQGQTPTAPYVAVALGKGWNQIGVPNPSAAGVPISSLKFDNGAGGMITFAQASSSQYNLVTNPLYAYAGGGYQALTATGVLKPWSGYWIFVNSPATLEIPTK